MIKITVIAVGKLKEAFWRDACAEYLKRLAGYAQVRVIEIADSTLPNEAKALATALKPALTERAPVVLLDIHGNPTSSEDLSSLLTNYALNGHSHVIFVIGGSEGVSEDVKQLTNKQMSFGPITLPHNLARVVLLEQLYRAFKIAKNEPYHK